MNYDTHPVPIEDESLSRADRRRATKPDRRSQAVLPAVWKAIHSPVAYMGNKQLRKLLTKASDGDVLEFYHKARAILQEAEVARASGCLEDTENQKRLAVQVCIAAAELKDRDIDLPIPSEHKVA